jgi:hypothetical protein
MNLPRMPAIELLAEVCDVRAEVTKNEIRFLDALKLDSSDSTNSIDLGHHRLDWEVLLDFFIEFE